MLLHLSLLFCLSFPQEICCCNRTPIRLHPTPISIPPQNHTTLTPHEQTPHPLLALLAIPAAHAANPLKPAIVFLAAQRCHVNGTVDYACFQQHLPLFEKFVLQDDSSWMQKYLVTDGLVKTYDALKIDSPAATQVRAKAEIYAKATQTLDKSELGEIDDCRD